jgi:hypothetical protein
MPPDLRKWADGRLVYRVYSFSRPQRTLLSSLTSGFLGGAWPVSYFFGSAPDLPHVAIGDKNTVQAGRSPVVERRPRGVLTGMRQKKQATDPATFPTTLTGCDFEAPVVGVRHLRVLWRAPAIDVPDNVPCLTAKTVRGHRCWPPVAQRSMYRITGVLSPTKNPRGGTACAPGTFGPAPSETAVTRERSDWWPSHPWRILCHQTV